MKSKLNSGKFPIANPFKWLVFSKGWQRHIDFIFACRLAALAEYMKRKINISSGYRSTEEQIRSYKKTGGKLVNGIWTGGNGYAAKPGSSWHEYRLAIDASDAWLKALEKEFATASQVTLMRFGLFKPLTKGNGTSVREDWHIQPIETVGIKDKKSLEPKLINKLQRGDMGFEVIELQWRLNSYGYNLTANGNFEIITDEIVRDFQRSKGLVDDGIVGQSTWGKLYEAQL
ncbi:MAG: hypothetical protein A2Y23_10110 [Clostridiales bacterium GWB2_37_7]|nr:MAG: hypothetical protein A2Y23_10110 [Clostridiales bacterium GWB2_37_7]